MSGAVISGAIISGVMGAGLAADCVSRKRRLESAIATHLQKLRCCEWFLVSPTCYGRHSGRREATSRHSGAMRSIEPGISRHNLGIPDRRGACHRAALRADPFGAVRNDGARICLAATRNDADMPSPSRDTIRPSCDRIFRPNRRGRGATLEVRARGMPDARCTRGLVCKM